MGLIRKPGNRLRHIYCLENCFRRFDRKRRLRFPILSIPARIRSKLPQSLQEYLASRWHISTDRTVVFLDSPGGRRAKRFCHSKKIYRRTLYASIPYLCLTTTLLPKQGCDRGLLPGHVAPAIDDLCPLIESPLGKGQAKLSWSAVRLYVCHPPMVRFKVRQLKLREVCSREEEARRAAAFGSEALPPD